MKLLVKKHLKGGSAHVNRSGQVILWGAGQACCQLHKDGSKHLGGISRIAETCGDHLLARANSDCRVSGFNSFLDSSQEF